MMRKDDDLPSVIADMIDGRYGRDNDQSQEGHHDELGRPSRPFSSKGRDIRPPGNFEIDNWIRRSDVYEHLKCGKLVYKDMIKFHDCKPE